MTRGSFFYGEQLIAYDVIFVPGLTGKVAIHVNPDGAVQVDAPDGEDLGKVNHAVRKRARWIKRGESLFYLGRRYQLKVAAASGAAPAVKLTRGQIQVSAPCREAASVRSQLTAWYRARAEEVFARRLAEIADSTPWLKALPEWRMVSMRKQWGSCSPSGQILLNPHLVKAPRPCVDYVICHELCHLQEHNHSPRYYRLLSQMMPGWEPVKARLDGMAELLLNE